MKPLPPDQSGSEESPDVPGFRHWRGIYLFVFICFVICVVLLALFSRAFASGAIGSGEPTLGRSAELHSAVSQICNLQDVQNPNAPSMSNALPNAIRRYSRVQLCATAVRNWPSRAFA